MKRTFNILIFSALILTNTYGSVDSIKRDEPLIYYVDSTSMSESKAYKMLYENQVKSNDAVLKTIFYALGGLGTAILLVFGSNWWFNDKKVKDVIRDNEAKIGEIKNSLFSELSEKFNIFYKEKTSEMNIIQVKLQDDITKSISEIGLRFSELQEKIRNENKEDSQILQNNYHDLLKSYNDNLIQQINGSKDAFEEKIKLLSKQIEEYDNKLNDRLSQEYNNIKREILLHNADIAYLQESYYNAFKYYLDLAIFDYELHDYWRFEYTFQNIMKCFSEFDYIYTDYGLAELNKLIHLYGGKYPASINILKDNLKNKNEIRLMK